MELRVFTLPTCKDCPAAKKISQEIAQKYKLNYIEVDISTVDGQLEGLMHQIMSTPSIAIDGEVIARGKLLSQEELETEIRKRLGYEAA
ncbi:MAG: thioredoxin family protein [Candidatus Bathyarchaeota archaeon]|nr:MAG: thioredoxin family protein [Candidatus Bathyarchaeota archaeon]